MLAADYPFLDVIGTIFVFFLWIIWFFLLFRILADIFQRKDIGGGAKTLWVIFVIILPFLGVFVYLISQNDGMTQRQTAAVEAHIAKVCPDVQLGVDGVGLQRYAPEAEAVINGFQAIGIRSRLQPLERAAFYKADQEKSFKHLVRVQDNSSDGQ